MKAAIPVFQSRVSPVFDWCRTLLEVEIRPGEETTRKEIDVDGLGPAQRANLLLELGTELLVCGTIGEQLLPMIEARGVRVITGVAGGIDEVLEALAAGDLPNPRLDMPGCRRRHRGGGRRRGTGPGPKGHGRGRGGR